MSMFRHLLKDAVNIFLQYSKVKYLKFEVRPLAPATKGARHKAGFFRGYVRGFERQSPVDFGRPRPVRVCLPNLFLIWCKGRIPHPQPHNFNLISQFHS
jgi:hypothetical protein